MRNFKKGKNKTKDITVKIKREKNEKIRADINKLAINTNIKK